MTTYASLGDNKMRKYPSLKGKATIRHHQSDRVGTPKGILKTRQAFTQMSPGAQQLLGKMKEKRATERRQKKEASVKQHRKAAGL